MRLIRTPGLPQVMTGLLVVLLSAGALGADAQDCNWTEEKTPSRAADPGLWSGLQPTEHGTGLASDRDTTDFTTNTAFTHSKPLWRSIDATGGIVFAGYNLGLHIYDARGGHAAVPTLLNSIKIDNLPILHREPHDFYVITDVDAVDGDSSVVVMTGWDGVGLVAVDASVPSAPKLFYQDGGPVSGVKYGEGVYATKINNRYYGFLATQNGTDTAGLWMYDLSAGIDTVCAEARPAEVKCPGVFKTKLSDSPQSHVDGAGTDQLGHFVAFSGGLGGPLGLEIWKVTQSGSPSQVLEGFSSRRVDGLAMWEQAGKFYLAVTLRRDKTNPQDEGRIYDVSCIKTGCAVNPLNGTALYGFPLTGSSGLTTRTTASHGVSDGQHYLHVGRKLSFVLDGLQAEWLLNVTSPASPVDVTGGNPKNGNLGQPTIDFEGQEVGYWSWYHACSPSGSNFFEPADGAVSGGYFYRAGRSILDVHEMKDANPTLLVSVDPTTTYTGTQVQAQASALNCTPTAGGWTWTAGTDATIPDNGSSSVSIEWSSTGTKTVSVSNSGCPGASVSPVSVTVQQAAPAVGSVTSDVTSAQVCSPITFTAHDVTGKPTLQHAWEIRDGADQPVTQLSSTSKTATWNTSAATVPGSYKARYTVSNTVDSDFADSAAVTVSELDPLGFSAPIDATVSFGNVIFAANATGATEWLWTFGDGQTLQTTDPVVGPAPSHSYDAVGTYDVTVQIRNCVETTFQSSAVKQVEITEINPLLIDKFEAPPGPFGLIFDEDTAVTFVTEVSGDPEFFDYDWDGNGTYEDANRTSAATSHIYNTPGLYRPVLRIRKGAAEQVFQHVKEIEISEVVISDPPSLSLSGPLSGKVDVAATFQASASNCTPTSYSWTTSGGQVSGSGATVQITWASSGSKTVGVTAAGCTGASASRSINIQNADTTNPSPLKAAFVSAPSAPQPGQAVNFDAASSEGNPSSYDWDFGDGSSATGKQTSHTYTQPGSYQVTLEVAKDDSACQFGVCTDEVSKLVVVDGGQTVPATNGCSGDLANDPGKLCLLDERFVAEVSWRDQHNNNRTGEGTGIAYNDQGVTGFFWFFSPKKVELLVKVLDATDVQTGLGNYWIFYGSLSDVHYKLKVTDTLTGKVKEYENEEGSLCGLADTGAFTVEAGDLTAGSSAVLPFAAADSGRVAQPIGGAGSDPVDSLLLHDGRFQVSVDWKNQHNNGVTGKGTAIPGTLESGYFWFFNQRNLELAVKIVDASALGEGYWIFWAGLSDVEYTLRVDDLLTGKAWSRVNAPGNFCGGVDGKPVFN